MVNLSKRLGIIETALPLFAKHGFQAISIDRIIEDSNVAKTTFYKHFPTKENLIENVLYERDRFFREGLIAAVEKNNSSIEQLKAIFEWHFNWFYSSDFSGCMFIKASDEIPSSALQIHRIVKDHKNWIRILIKDILIKAGIHQADQWSNFLLIQLDGLIVNANIFGMSPDIEQSWELMNTLLNAAKKD